MKDDILNDAANESGQRGLQSENQYLDYQKMMAQMSDQKFQIENIKELKKSSTNTQSTMVII